MIIDPILSFFVAISILSLFAFQALYKKAEIIKDSTVKEINEILSKKLIDDK